MAQTLGDRETAPMQDATPRQILVGFFVTLLAAAALVAIALLL
jgi:uncharacterized membrane protein